VEVTLSDDLVHARSREGLARSRGPLRLARGVRPTVVLGSIVLALLVVLLALPSARDTSVAAWWTRVRYQAAIAFRIALAWGASR
jgi:hypothetical protein